MNQTSYEYAPPPAPSPFAYGTTFLLLPVGFYLLRAFELWARWVAALSLLPQSGRILPKPVEIALLCCQAVALAVCFAPAAWMLLDRLASRRALRPSWMAVLSSCLLLFGIFQSAQQSAYLQIRAALPISTPHASQCPSFSASNLAYYASRLLYVSPEILVDSDNEQCTTLKLAHDTELGVDQELEVFKTRVYDPRFIATHFAENTIFPMAAVIAKSLRAAERIPADRNAALAIADRARIASNGLEAIDLVLRQQTHATSEFDPGPGPLASAVARIRAWEERAILSGMRALLGDAKARVLDKPGR